jgi:hypothetical protein
VEWVDAWYQDGWVHELKLDDEEPMVSVGFVAHCDKVQVVLAQSRSVSGQLGNVQGITWRQVVCWVGLP